MEICRTTENKRKIRECQPGSDIAGTTLSTGQAVSVALLLRNEDLLHQ